MSMPPIQLSRDIETGMVWIEEVSVPFPHCAWSGVKDSGRDTGLLEAAIRGYSLAEHISIETGQDVRRPWWYPYAPGMEAHQ
jgi:acyl-CoA reductase-like NAD-dependent aldehyde dehydrogenase